MKRSIVELESALADSEERFRSLSEAAREGISVHDGSRILIANERLAEMFGYSLDELLGHDPLDFMAPDARQAIAKNIASGMEQPYESWGRRRNGVLFPVEINARSAVYRGRPVRVVVITDVSEKRASDTRFQVLFENTRDAIAVSDGDVLTWANAALARMLRAETPAALVGRVVYDLIAPESRGVMREQKANRPVGHIDPAVYTVRGLRLDGTTFDAEIRASTFQSGSGAQTIAFVRDITAERAAEEALRLSELRFRSLVDQSPVSTQIFSADGIPIRANRAWEDLFGVTLEQIAGYNILHDQQLIDAGLMPLVERAFRGETVYLPETCYVPDRGTRKGEILWIEAIMYPVLDGGNTISEVVLLHQDVTEHKRAEEALAKKAGELARSNADLQQFAYVTSHDLQEPLRVMSTFASLLSRRYAGKLDAQADKYLEFMTTAANRMSELVRDILAYSRLNSPEAEEFASVDLNAVMSTVIHALQGAIESAGAQLTVATLPQVRGNRAQLTQLFLNLISNALKYRRADQSSVITVTAAHESSEWRITVRDNGIGIAPEYHERIFGMFKRLHGGQYEGTGIGLAMARRIAEAHRGRIVVASAEGEGAAFSVYLPDA